MLVICAHFPHVASHFYWDKMCADVCEFVGVCQVCQCAKQVQTFRAGLLSPLLVPSRVWDDIAIDFITGLPASHGYTVIFVMVDHMCKYAHFALLPSNFTVVQVDDVFLSTMVKLHSFPSSIMSDRDKVFTSSFWRHLFKLQDHPHK